MRQVCQKLSGKTDQKTMTNRHQEIVAVIFNGTSIHSELTAHVYHGWLGSVMSGSVV